MSDTRLLTIALAAVPTMLTVLVGILDQQRKLNDLNNRIADLRIDMDSRFGHVNHRFDEVRDLWHAELYRVEEVLDARLKHIEARGARNRTAVTIARSMLGLKSTSQS